MHRAAVGNREKEPNPDWEVRKSFLEEVYNCAEFERAFLGREEYKERY